MRTPTDGEEAAVAGPTGSTHSANIGQPIQGDEPHNLDSNGPQFL